MAALPQDRALQEGFSLARAAAVRRLRTFGRRRSGRRVLRHNRANPPARSRSRGGGQESLFHARAAKSLRRCGHSALLPAGSFCPAAAGAAWAASNGTGTQGAGLNVLVFEKLLRSLCNWKGPLSVVGLSAAISSTAPQPAASTVIARNPREDDSVVGDRVADRKHPATTTVRGFGHWYLGLAIVERVLAVVRL